MTRTKMRWTAAGFCAACAMVAAGAETWTMNLVDEMKAMADSGACSNEWTATRGGTWGIFKDGASRPYAEYANSGRKLVGFYDNNYKYFTFLANTNTVSVWGPWDGSVPAGQVYFHPHDGSSVQTLRYVAATPGVYSVSGSLAHIGTKGNGDGVAGQFVAVGQTLTNIDTTADNVARPFCIEGIELSAGDALELKLSAGAKKNFSGDATGVDFSLSRTGDYLEQFSTTVSRQLAMALENVPPANPRVCADGGSWSFLSRTSGVDTPMTNKYVNAWVSSKLAGLSLIPATTTEQIYPRILVNRDVAALRPSDSTYSIQPNEIFLHPNQNNAVVVRYTVAISGRYSFSATARNMMDLGNSLLKVDLDGNNLASMAVKDCTNGVVANLSREALPLVAGQHLDFIFDANGSHSYDGTGVLISLSRDEVHPELKCYSLVNAFRAAMKEATPTASRYVAPDGGVWSFGHCGMNQGLKLEKFQSYSILYSDGAFLGWHAGTEPFQGRYYPYLMVNTNNAAGSVLAHETSVPANVVAYHPGDGATYGVMRFHAPQDGLYSVAGYFKSINNQFGDGVDGYVLVNGVAFVTNGIACRKANTHGWKDEVSFDINALWLKANDTLDIAIGPNTEGYSCDATVVKADVLYLGALPAEPYVSFDILGSARAAYAGTGRIGVQSDAAWTALDAAGGKTKSEFTLRGADKLAVRLELSKPAGSLVVGTTTGVASPVSDGVVSSGASDPVTFRVQGLVPGADYTFYAYGRNASGKPGAFSVAGETFRTTECWFCPKGGDWCSFTATADATGCVTGTFSGTEDGAATFSALQVTGADFPVYIPKDTLVIFR